MNRDLVGSIYGRDFDGDFLKLEAQWAEHVSLSFEETLYRTFYRCFLSNFSSFGYSVSEEKISHFLPLRYLT
jgi:hypothetical protein